MTGADEERRLGVRPRFDRLSTFVLLALALMALVVLIPVGGSARHSMPAAVAGRDAGATLHVAGLCIALAGALAPTRRRSSRWRRVTTRALLPAVQARRPVRVAAFAPRGPTPLLVGGHQRC